MHCGRFVNAGARLLCTSDGVCVIVYVQFSSVGAGYGFGGGGLLDPGWRGDKGPASAELVTELADAASAVAGFDLVVLDSRGASDTGVTSAHLLHSFALGAGANDAGHIALHLPQS
jgi:hypothetical protein